MSPERDYNRTELLNSLSDANLAERSMSIGDQIDNLQMQPDNQIFTDRTIPALYNLKHEADQILEGREMTVANFTAEDFKKRFDPLLKGRREVNRVARNIASGFTLFDIAEKTFGENNEHNRFQAEVWVNTINIDELEPNSIHLHRKKLPNGDIAFKLVEIKKAEALVETQKTERTPQFTDNPVPDSRLNALAYVTTSDDLRLDKLQETIGKTKSNLLMTWAQAQRSLVTANRILADRIGFNNEGKLDDIIRKKLSDLEKSTWDILYLKFLEENEFTDDIDEVKAVSNYFKEKILRTVNPHENPGILWPSENDKPTDDQEYAEEIPLQSMEVAILNTSKTVEVISVETEKQVKQPPSPKDYEMLCQLMAGIQTIQIDVDETVHTLQIPEHIQLSATAYVGGNHKESLPFDLEGLIRIQEKLSVMESALELIVNTSDENLQNILFWLEDHNEIIFKILEKLDMDDDKNKAISFSSQELEDDRIRALLTELISSNNASPLEISETNEDLSNSDIAPESPNSDSNQVEMTENTDPSPDKNKDIDLENIVNMAVKRIGEITAFSQDKILWRPFSSATNIGISDIKTAIQQGIIKTTKKGTDMPLSRVDAAALIARKNLGNSTLSPRQKKQMLKMIEAKFKQQKDEPSSPGQPNGK